MKLVSSSLIFVFLFTNTLQDESSEQELKRVQGIFQQCAKDSKVSDESLTALRNGEPVEDPLLDKYLLCSFGNLEFIDHDGKVQLSVIKNEFQKLQWDDEQIDGFLNKCTNQQPTPEKTAYNMGHCWYKLKNEEN